MRVLATVAAITVAIAGSVPTLVTTSARDVKNQWHLAFLRVAEAHRTSQGAEAVIGLADSGVDARHPDLAGSILDGIDLSVDRSDSKGKEDILGHGTAMAGIMVAHGSVTGIAPKAKVIPIRDGVGNGYHLSEALEWAMNHGVKVMCVAQGTSKDDVGLRAAVQRAIAADIVVVASAGNRPGIDKVRYPAAYHGVIAVGGVDAAGNPADVSVQGPELVLSAPAVEIMTTGLNGGYQATNGTSSSAAIVAGVAALVRSKYPDMSAEEVVHRMTATAIDKGPKGRDDQYGYGIVDPVAALTADVPPLGESAQPGEASQPAESDPTGRIVLFGGIGLAALVLLTGLVLARRRR